MSETEIYKRPKESILSALLSLDKDKLLPIVKGPLTEVLHYKAKLWVDMVDKSVIDHTLKILELTKKVKPENSRNIDKIISELGTYKLVFDDEGKWSYINKLNTNYSDYSILIADLLDSCCETVKANKIYRGIKTDPKPETDLLAKYISLLPKESDYIWERFLCDQDRYTQNIKKNSADGELIENNVVNKLVDSGWDIIHLGGNGDFIDMKLGIDIIAKKNDRYSYIQVKKCNSIEEVQIGEQNYIQINGIASHKINTSYLDEIAYGTLDGQIFIGGRQIYYNIKDGEITDSFLGLPIVSRANQYTILSKI